MQQSNAAAAAALYDHPGAAGGSLYNGGSTSDAGDAVMARWLQSTGLQHLASPLASNHMPNLLMQVCYFYVLAFILTASSKCDFNVVRIEFLNYG